MMRSPLQDLLAKSAELHNHLCPRQVLGVRMGMLAGQLFPLELPQEGKRLFAFVETDGCFSDGVAVASGCWLGHRTMRLMDYGRVAVTFVDTQTEQAVRIWPHPQARINARDCEPDARSHWHAQLEAYQTLPDDQLLCWQPVALNVSMKQIISRPGVRVHCACCGEEILNEREVISGSGDVLCAACAGEAYYRPLDGDPQTLLLATAHAAR
jgi:formylmethanofuran dehydrogenase subunit E